MDTPAPPREPRPLARVLSTVVAAATIAFAIDLLLYPPAGVADVVLRAIRGTGSTLFAYAVGWWLGTRTWPKRGRRLAETMLRRAAKREHKVLFVSDRPDFPPKTARRVLEVVGFAAGSSVLFAGAITMLGLGGRDIAALSFSFTLVALWLSLILVPYWLFARVGLRRVDAVRWVVEPMSRSYADRLRLSNGALLLIALGVLFNVLFRAGQSRDAALIIGVLVLVQVVASVLVTAAAGVAHYNLKEKALVREFEARALALGIRDGRGMSDGDFLPRLPPAPRERAAQVAPPPSK